MILTDFQYRKKLLLTFFDVNCTGQKSCTPNKQSKVKFSLDAKDYPPSFSATHIINNTGTINATLIIGPSVKEMSSAGVDQESYLLPFSATVDHDDSLSKNEQVKHFTTGDQLDNGSRLNHIALFLNALPGHLQFFVLVS